MTWKRDGGAPSHRDEHLGHAGPGPGKRTLTQSIPSIQRRAASELSSSSARTEQAGESSGPADALIDPFDFRFPPVAVQRKAAEGRACACGTCESCRGGSVATEVNDDATRPVQRRATGHDGGRDPEAAVAQGLASSGQPLDDGTRGFMESRFGQDFNDVRVHTDGAAGESARALAADAYTVGRDVVFAPGQYEPGSTGGQRLLAHELTHVVQQGGGRPDGGVAQRQAAAGSAAAAPGAGAERGAASGDSTAKLQHLIASIERVQARATADTGERAAGADAETDATATPGDAADVTQHHHRVDLLLQQLRAVAAGSDEAAKQRVLRAFSPAGAHQAEAILESQVKVEQRRPEGMAARSVQVSDPSDAAEVEAERVADAVMAGGSAAVQERAVGPHRQVAEALIGGGIAVLEVDAVTAPEAGPPGWVVGGIVALGALAAIGVGYILMSSAGNVADTGIMEEAQALIASGAAATICAALQILMDQARDAARKLRIKKTQKAKGCRHSRHS